MPYTTTNSPTERTGSLTESDRYSLLTAERRRLVLDILDEQTYPVKLAELASTVTEREAGLDGTDTETVEHVKLSLHHTHLPKMAELGVLTYDVDTRRVIPNDEPIEIDVSALGELDVETDALFTVLSNSRRRAVLGCLHDYHTPMSLGDVADEVAVWEYDTTITDIPAAKVKMIYCSLYHEHLPKMEDLGLVRYSQERDAVALTADGTELTSIARLPSIR